MSNYTVYFNAKRRFWARALETVNNSGHVPQCPMPGDASVHCNLRPPDAEQSSTALTETPVPSLKSVKLSLAVMCFTVDTLLYAVTLTFDL